VPKNFFLCELIGQLPQKVMLKQPVLSNALPSPTKPVPSIANCTSCASRKKVKLSTHSCSACKSVFCDAHAPAHQVCGFCVWFFLSVSHENNHFLSLLPGRRRWSPGSTAQRRDACCRFKPSRLCSQSFASCWFAVCTPRQRIRILLQLLSCTFQS
jgi:hypothetical protein